jgi:hypothetical protein
MENVITACLAEGLNLRTMARNQFNGHAALEIAKAQNIPSSEVLATLDALGYCPITIQYLKEVYA